MSPVYLFKQFLGCADIRIPCHRLCNQPLRLAHSMAEVLYQHFLDLLLEVHTLWAQWNLIFHHQRELPHFSLQSGDDLVRRPSPNPFETFKRLRIPFLNCLCNLGNREDKGLHCRRGTDILDSDKLLKKFFLRLKVEADQKGLGLSFGLMVVDVKLDHLSILAGSFRTEGLSNNGGKQDLITHAVCQNDNPIFFFLEEPSLDVSYHFPPAFPVPVLMSVPARSKDQLPIPLTSTVPVTNAESVLPTKVIMPGKSRQSKGEGVPGVARMNGILHPENLPDCLLDLLFVGSTAPREGTLHLGRLDLDNRKVPLLSGEVDDAHDFPELDGSLRKLSQHEDVFQNEKVWFPFVKEGPQFKKNRLQAKGTGEFDSVLMAPHAQALPPLGRASTTPNPVMANPGRFQSPSKDYSGYEKSHPFLSSSQGWLSQKQGSFRR